MALEFSPVQQLLFSKKQAAQLLAISVRTLDYMIASKEITVRRIGRRILIPLRSLQEFARRDHPTRAAGDEVCRHGED